MNLYQLLWLFLFYSFAGWAVATVFAALRERKFVDVGVLYGPLCPAYGFIGVFFALFLPELREHPLFLVLGGVILAGFLTQITGFVTEKIFRRRWWDYSGRKFQFGGYFSLADALIWGAIAFVSIRFLNPLLLDAAAWLPAALGRILLLLCYILLAADLSCTIATLAVIRSKVKQLALVEDLAEQLEQTADYMGHGLAGWALRHLAKSYPNLNFAELVKQRREERRQEEESWRASPIFAAGCSYYKLIWVFLIGAFGGDIVETIFCYVTSGVLMSRSSVVYGPFSIVWGLGAAFLTILLYQYRDRSDRFIFFFGTVVGGAYEYVCSVFTELVFGTVFWDYSHIPFNLGGRINLLYCFFWGFAAVVWIKALYPPVSRLVEKIPKPTGVPLTWVLAALMVVNIAMSSLALARYTERQTSPTPSQTAVGLFLDRQFPDERMERIYPNAQLVS